MKLDIKGNEISYDGRRESLLVSYLAQNCSSKAHFRKKIDGELLGFVGLVPEMGPEHLVVLRWHAGYEFGYPMDYYGIGAIACKSIKPWKHHQVDHLIQNKNPFAKVTDPTLLNQISLDYDSRTANVMEGNDSMNNYFLSQEELERALKEAGFKCGYSMLADPEEVDEVLMGPFEDYLDIVVEDYLTGLIEDK